MVHTGRAIWSALLAAVSTVLTTHVAQAQPADSAVLRDVRAPGQLTLRLMPARNTPQRTGPSSWEFLRGYVVTRRTEHPGVTLRVLSQAMYLSPNGRSWRFSRSLTTSNSYDGIPAPSGQEINALIARDLPGVYRTMVGTIVGQPPAPTLATDPQFEFPSLIRVSFRMLAELDVVTSNTTVERVRMPFEVNMYRDRFDSPWVRLNATPIHDAKEVLATRTLDAALVARMTRYAHVLGGQPSRTVDEWVGEGQRSEAQASARRGSAEERAQFRVSAQPAAPIAPMAIRAPLWQHAVAQVHQQLRSADRAGLEAFLRGALAPTMSAQGALTPDGVALVSDALFEVFSSRGNFREQFCGPMTAIPAQSPPNGLMLVGAVPETTALVQMQQIAGLWYIQRLQIRARHDDDALQFVQARPRAQLCPGG
jgi:hypothetical protein